MLIWPRPPKQAARIGTRLQAADSKSVLMVPLHYGGSFFGFIGCDTLREQRDWSDADVHLLRLAGEIIVNGLERIRTLVRLQRSEASLRRRPISCPAGQLGMGPEHE